MLNELIKMIQKLIGKRKEKKATVDVEILKSNLVRELEALHEKKVLEKNRIEKKIREFVNKTSNEESPIVPRDNSITVLPTNSVATIHYFLNSNTDLTYRFLMGKLSRAIKSNDKDIKLFRIGNTPFVSRIVNGEYEKFLTDIQNYYIKKEDFVRAARCRDLIIKNKVNMVIEETKL